MTPTEQSATTRQRITMIDSVHRRAENRAQIAKYTRTAVRGAVFLTLFVAALTIMYAVPQLLANMLP